MQAEAGSEVEKYRALAENAYVAAMGEFEAAVGESLRHVLEELQRVAPARGDSGSGREPSIPRGGGILRTS